METKEIENVAIYLRKSRGDETDALNKHRLRLTSYAEKQGWKYQLYEEKIKSGERLITRPVLLNLLNIIENGVIFDAILVTDYDRLSRGQSKDFGEIIEALQVNDTYIATPEKTYDVNDSNDLTLLGMKGVLSNNELRTIVQRFQNGKKDGVTEGKLTNGKPPYPYYYDKKIVYDEIKKRDKIIGTVKIDQHKLLIYKEIIDMYINKKIGTEQISIILNKREITPPSGNLNGTWSSTTVQRLLLHEFHLGKLVYGKTIWKKTRDGKRVMKGTRDESEWATGDGKHEPVKTKEEHKAILKNMKDNKKVPHRSMQGVFPTSGLVYCKKCGHRMGYSIGRLEAKTGKKYDYIKCSFKSPYGVKCPQKGLKMDEDFYENLYSKIINDYVSTNMIDKNNAEKQNIYESEILDLKKKQLQDEENALEKIMTAFENGLYTMEQFAERKPKKEANIKKLKTEIAKSAKLLIPDKLSPQELNRLINDFKEGWKTARTNEIKNKLLKKVVSKIFYDRDGDNITIEIEYL